MLIHSITERNAKNYPSVILFFSESSVAYINLSEIANRSAKSVQHEMHSFANNKLTKARIIGRAGLQPSERDYSTFISSRGNSETDSSRTARKRSLLLSKEERAEKPARIGNEREEDERVAAIPLLWQFADQINSITSLIYLRVSTWASTNDP